MTEAWVVISRKSIREVQSESWTWALSDNGTDLVQGKSGGAWHVDRFGNALSQLRLAEQAGVPKRSLASLVND